MHTEIEVFFRKIKRSYSSNFPFVVYRKPNEELVTAYFQKTQKLHRLDSFEERGFVFAPFDKNEHKIVFPESICERLTILINAETDLKIALEKTSVKSYSTIQSKNKYIKLVQNAIDLIKRNKAKKIVLSRKETVELADFDLVNSLKKILKSHRGALVYLWYHPAVGLWMGATPERLVSICQNKFETMALAGTQLYNGTTDVRWNEKEKQEQQFVTDFILSNIEASIERIEIKGPYSVNAGNLLHLRTDISGKLKAAISLGSLINSLHPTPAVCGLPKEVATKYILQNEAYHRAYYSGYLGELNMNGAIDLFVNLRCMQLENSVASIYVGGGITKDSNAKKEWEETVAKAEIIKKVLLRHIN